MARPREFDEAAALDAAIECFWTRGYEATSVRDLAERMGITGASLYNAFGDKHALFRRALDRYSERGTTARIARLEGQVPPRQAIETVLRDIIEESLRDTARKGCLVINSALEVAPHEPDCRQAVADRLGRIEAFFCRAVAAGQADGTITPVLPPEDVARNLLAVLLGIRVMARVQPERELFEGMLRSALTLLGPVTPAAG
ncbi:TetR/AcrR family transcriptional regulator [Gluconacetobacter tumulisoli]|uniref:TetR/AcrR family transcriptional regulator n=2 Tax=Gluconacetobacter tumulisoli TaxID=1286189 RepID=A0A7W4PLL3_9PROT|nr:TetR/AcrR family transcriptional regulator [Gluconacetobacter tumulisoli]